jgi:hypothetical protein
MIRFAAIIPAAAMLLTAGVASATDTGGVKINGTVENYDTAYHNYNTAVGNDTVAVHSNGSIHGGTEVNGTLYNDDYAHDTENTAVGNGSVACQSIGSIGDAKGCEAKY